MPDNEQFRKEFSALLDEQVSLGEKLAELCERDEIGNE